MSLGRVASSIPVQRRGGVETIRRAGSFGSTGARPSGRVDSLTGLRWFAALGVFLFHTAALAPLPLLGPLMRIGYEGVPFFFVLSGFVLTWSARPDDTTVHFYVRRFARVWPLLAVTTLPALAIAHWWKGEAFSATGLLATLTLTQAWSTDHFFTANIVTWTLSCEAFFYLVFPFVLRLLTRLRPAGLLTVALVMQALTLLSRTWPGSEAFPFQLVRLTYASPLALTPMFITGMCVALAVRQGWRPWLGVRGSLLLLTAVVLLRWRSAYQPGLVPGFPPDADYFDSAVLPVFALLIAAAAVRDCEGRPSLFRRPALVRLGEWSFAFYIVHVLVLDGMRHYGLLAGLETAHGKLAVLLLAALLCTAAAAVLHHVVEKPADRGIRSAFKRRLDTRG
ncbi:acyltransferase family protein [Streptomyces sp. NPDC006879]|uniref:acyltransferase family protein n=1 Tax=Streptomyces sp. NPDC006879 TaxID=3364767 RepID=UPI0036A2B53C